MELPGVCENPSCAKVMTSADGQHRSKRHGKLYCVSCVYAHEVPSSHFYVRLPGILRSSLKLAGTDADTNNRENFEKRDSLASNSFVEYIPTTGRRSAGLASERVETHVRKTLDMPIRQRARPNKAANINSITPSKTFESIFTLNSDLALIAHKRSDRTTRCHTLFLYVRAVYQFVTGKAGRDASNLSQPQRRRKCGGHEYQAARILYRTCRDAPHQRAGHHKTSDRRHSDGPHSCHTPLQLWFFCDESGSEAIAAREALAVNLIRIRCCSWLYENTVDLRMISPT
jgi:hypothetical protein